MARSPHNLPRPLAPAPPSGSGSAAKLRRAWDRAGVALSGLCLVHCLAVPLLTLVVPGAALMGVSLGGLHGPAHALFAVALAPVTLAAIWQRTGHRHLRSTGLLLAGLACILLALPAGAFFAESAETALTFGGSVLLVTGHLT